MPDVDHILRQREPGDPGTSRSFAHWRQTLHTVIFEADTPAARLLHPALLVAILPSTLPGMLDTVDPIDK